MVLTKEFRICMPLTVEEYQIGQLYMIARHSLEQSGDGEGVEVVDNSPCEDPEHGKGQYTEKRIHLSSRLPFWAQAICPRVFYITEKSWNYYPFTITEYTCSFIPKLNIFIKTKYENNNGSSDNCIGLTEAELKTRIIDELDIGFDELSSAKHYKREEDPKFFKSEKTGRGPLIEGWRENDTPIMCSYKVVQASFEVWGFQTRVEDFIQRSIRDILLLGHRQAFTWLDEWLGMTLEDVREYEKQKQAETNEKLKNNGVEDETVPVDVVNGITSPPTKEVITVNADEID
ncbi:cytoplasmic phosphatidylinositol transfer protein 1 [Teleopsis dalmanni]|uniref:cytoplasmic phosphatidylinositol transfer protein 1 n=1 Tax=Teleopsis dalmanni TaxID=139649 RepID=UPI0018CE520A|nr:cytoplasmic phosphatidylinositol transfer protein 1 [Teleopsis dalmanni]